MGLLGMKMTERFADDVAAMALTTSWFHSLVDHWKKPLQHAINPHLEAHQEALKMGALEESGYNLAGYFITYYYGGLRLGPFLKDIPKFIAQLLDYGQKGMLMAILPYW